MFLAEKLWLTQAHSPAQSPEPATKGCGVVAKDPQALNPH